MEFKLGIEAGDEFVARLKAKSHEVGHLIQDALDDIALFIEGDAKGRAGFRTGNLRRNINRVHAKETRPGHHEAVVGVSRTAPYGVWHHEGTGIFGARRRPIRPQTGNVLVFSVGGRTVFARSVKGQRANPFMREAYRTAQATYAPGRVEKLRHDIGNL